MQGSAPNHVSEAENQRKTIKKALPWESITLLGAIGCILMTAYRYLDLAHGGAVLTYLLYPVAIFSIALLIYTRDYIKYWEIRLMGVFMIWVLAVIAMNYGRASNAISSAWFHSLISISFLCFSLPYAFREIKPQTAMRVLSAATILLTAITGAAALALALRGRTITLGSGAEGVLGMDAEGRLELFNHPNIAASACGLSMLLSAWQFLKTKSKPIKILLVFAAAICYIALALTDSRTGIIATAFAAGYIVFLLCGASKWLRNRKWAKLGLSVLISLTMAAAIYAGTSGIKQVYNGYVQHRSVMEQKTELSDAQEAQSRPTGADFEEVSSRSLSDASTFNGRTLIWKGTIQGLAENPKILLTGTTPLISGELMTSYISVLEPMKNFHNSFLSVLVGLGVPGLLLFAAFMIYLCILCIQIILKHWGDDACLNLKMLTGIVLFTTLYGLMEQLIITDSMPNLVWIWLMLAAGYIMKALHDERNQLRMY